MEVKMKKNLKKNHFSPCIFPKMCYNMSIRFVKGNPIYDESGSSVVPFFPCNAVQGYNRDLTAGSFPGI